MRLDLKRFSMFVVALAALATTSAQAEMAAPSVDVPLMDVRDDSAEAIQRRALKYAKDGIVVVYSGQAAQLKGVVDEIAGECANRGFQVKAVLLAKAGAGEGVVLYGQDGGPLGPRIEINGDLKMQTASQVEQLRGRLERTQSGSMVVDSQDVVRCRYESNTGSLVRKTKVCSTPRQDAERTKRSKDWTSEQQNRGASEPMKGN